MSARSFRRTSTKWSGQLSAANQFVPLADVPDEIWKKLPSGSQGREGGRDTKPGPHGSTGPEHPNHYADIDAPFGPAGETWRALCLADDAKISPAAWLDFYDELASRAQAAGDSEAAAQYRDKLHQGLLPLRIWQFYDAMVDCVSRGDIVGYVTAAGTAAHYVGDACQPLHGSIYSDGDRSRTVVRHHPQTGEDETVKFGDGVHSAYETSMLAAKATVLLPLIDATLPAAGQGHGLPLCTSGKEIARAVLALMDRSCGHPAAADHPRQLRESGCGHPQGNARRHVVGPRRRHRAGDGRGRTGAGHALGVGLDCGGGGSVAASQLKAIERDDIRARYIDKNFVPSLTLDQIGAVLR